MFVVLLVLVMLGLLVLQQHLGLVLAQYWLLLLVDSQQQQVAAEPH